MLREKRPCSLFHFKEKPELAEWVVQQVCKIDSPLEHGFLRASLLTCLTIVWFNPSVAAT